MRVGAAVVRDAHAVGDAPEPCTQLACDLVTLADDGSPVGDSRNIARQIDEWELLDLQADPTETTNFYHDPKYQTVAAGLHRELDRLAREVGDTPGNPGLNQQGRLGPMTTGPETPPASSR